MQQQPARSEYKKVWSALSTTEEQARLHVIGVTEEAALQSTGEETLRFLQEESGIGKDDVVLEIGCGIGRVGKLWHRSAGNGSAAMSRRICFRWQQND